MADWVKIALKIGLVVGVMAALWAVFNVIQIPQIDFSPILTYAGKALTILTYYCPTFPIIWNGVLMMLSLLVSLWTFRFAQVVVKWLFKVNE